MPNPRKVLEDLKLFLEDDSYIYMTVPNLEFIPVLPPMDEST